MCGMIGDVGELSVEPGLYTGADALALLDVVSVM